MERSRDNNELEEELVGLRRRVQSLEEENQRLKSPGASYDSGGGASESNESRKWNTGLLLAIFAQIVKGDSETNLNQTLAMVGQLTGADRAYVVRFDDRVSRVRKIFEWDAPGVTAYKERRGQILLEEHEDIFSRFLRGKRAIISDVERFLENNTDLSEQVREFFQSANTRTHFSVPIKYDERILGICGLDGISTERNWGHKEIMILELMAEHIAGSQAYADKENQIRESEKRYRELFTQASDALDETQKNTFRLAMLNEMSQKISHTQNEEDIYKVTATYITRMISGDRIEIALLDPDGRTLTIYPLEKDVGLIKPGLKLPISEVSSGIAIRGKRVVTSSGFEESLLLDRQNLYNLGFHSSLLAPLISGGKVIGTLNLAEKQTNAFTLRDEHLVLQIASLIASNIETHRMFSRTQEVLTETEDHARRLSLLNEMSKEINLGTTETVIFQIATRYVRKIISANQSSMALSGRNGLEFEVVAIQDEYSSSPIPREMFPVKGTLFEKVTGQNQVLTVNRSELEAEAKMGEEIDDPCFSFKMNSIIMVPLVLGERVIGTINALAAEEDAFNSRDEELLKHIAAFLGATLQNIRRNEGMRMVVSNTSSKTGDNFFYSLVQNLADVLNVRYAFVTRYSKDDLKNENKISTFAFWDGDRIGENFTYALDVSPCKNVLQGSINSFPRQVRSMFPHSRMLSRLDAQSYLGIPLTAVNGETLGHLVIIDDRPMDNDRDSELFLQVFAARSGAELERSKSEQDLKNARDAAETANRSKSIFLANMSHELRTPLNAILGFSQLMSHDKNLEPKHAENLAIINRSGEHLLNLINDVLEMSKIEIGRINLEVHRFDFYSSIESLLEMLRLRSESKGLALHYEIRKGIPRYIVADEIKLRQVLLNLLGNALKFTEAGQVNLLIDHDYDKGETSEDRKDFRLKFKISDTGPGIPPEELDQIFKAFMQIQNKMRDNIGAGLGLTISKRFVSLMGGDLLVSSRLGEGSTFSFDILVSGSESGPPVHEIRNQRVIGLEPGQREIRILVVDDNEESRRFLVSLLELIGFKVREAENGERAVEIWHDWSPALIWMDMRMPVMDGYEATRIIKERAAQDAGEPDPVIIALTASAFEEQRTAVLEQGCDDFLRKPFREADLFAKISERLGVRFVYEEFPVKPSRLNSLPDEQKISTENLPAEFRERLMAAARQADTELITVILEEIRASHPDLCEQLGFLNHSFRFEQILKILTES